MCMLKLDCPYLTFLWLPIGISLREPIQRTLNWLFLLPGQRPPRKGVIYMLQIKNLTITHKKDLRVILDNFKLTLNAGDKAVIIGEEGNGKSTLMKWIVDPELADEYAECEGERIITGETIGYLPQELPAADGELTLYEYFAAKEAFLEQSPRDLSAMASDFGVPADFFYGDQLMKSLSGGEKIKAELMRILMERPSALLLDEPSNDIDIDTLKLLEKLINGFKGIVLFISHDETLIENTANMVVHLELVERKRKSRFTVMHLAYREYVETRLKNLEKQEQEAENDRRQKKIREDKYNKLYQSVTSALGNVSRQAPSVGKNLKDKMHTVKAMGKRFEKMDEEMTERPDTEEAIFFKLGGKDAAMPQGKTVVEYSLDKLTTPDESRVLSQDIFMRLRGPMKVCIVGDNGCGKTTLIKKMAEELMARPDIRVQYMPQNYEEMLNMDETPVDFLDKSGDKEERTRIRTYLGALKYTAEEMDHPIRALSGGQKAKVFLLKMSLSDANVLILDEPTRNFSPLSGPVIRGILKDFPGAIISISHDRKYISEVCDTVYELTESGLKEVEKFIAKD